MAILLVKDCDASHLNPDKDQMCYKRGDIVEVFEDSKPYVVPPAPPFLIVQVPGPTKAQAAAYMSMWERRLTFTVDQSNLTLDQHLMTVRAEASGVGASGLGAITREQVETFLTRWSAVVQSVAPNTVTFGVRILNAIQSEGFWGVPVGGEDFTELSYVSATGVHRVEAQYGGFNPESVEQRVIERGGVIVSHEPPEIVFDITRTAVREQFEDSVKGALERAIVRRIWRLPEAVLAATEANDRYLSMSVAAFQAAVLDKRTV